MSDEMTNGSQMEAVWRVDGARAPGYTFTNLSDHTAWQVVLHGEGEQTISIPGHVSYAEGVFRHELAPGTYWLSWITTVEMLKRRPDEPPRPIPQTVKFTIPIDSAAFELHRPSG